jgi:hypothetical protein
MTLLFGSPVSRFQPAQPAIAEPGPEAGPALRLTLFRQGQDVVAREPGAMVLDLPAGAVPARQPAILGAHPEHFTTPGVVTFQ